MRRQLGQFTQGVVADMLLGKVGGNPLCDLLRLLNAAREEMDTAAGRSQRIRHRPRRAAAPQHQTAPPRHRHLLAGQIS